METQSTCLTPREWEVLCLLAQGLWQAEVAERLVVSPDTIHSHVANIREKVGARNTAQAIFLVMVIGSTAEKDNLER